MASMMTRDDSQQRLNGTNALGVTKPNQAGEAWWNNCPECDYPLSGLPAPHRCPECGFAYDEHSHVWHGSGARDHLIRLWLVGAFLAVFGWIALRRGLSLKRDWLLLLVAVPWLYDVLCWLNKSYGSEPRISAAPDGLRVEYARLATRWTISPTPMHIKWVDLDRVKVHDFGDRATIKIKGFENIVGRVFEDRRSVEKFVETCRHYMSPARGEEDG